MNRMILMLAAATLLLSFASSVSAHEPFRWVGVSDSTVSPAIGRYAMNEACQSKFPDSRLCTSEEIALTLTLPTGMPAGLAWVQPVINAAAQGSTVANTVIVDQYSGTVTTASITLDCATWGSADDKFNGLVVRLHQGSLSPSGIIGTRNCINPTYVSCCASTKDKAK